MRALCSLLLISSCAAVADVHAVRPNIVLIEGADNIDFCYSAVPDLNYTVFWTGNPNRTFAARGSRDCIRVAISGAYTAGMLYAFRLVSGPTTYASTPGFVVVPVPVRLASLVGNGSSATFTVLWDTAALGADASDRIEIVKAGKTIDYFYTQCGCKAQSFLARPVAGGSKQMTLVAAGPASYTVVFLTGQLLVSRSAVPTPLVYNGSAWRLG